VAASLPGGAPAREPAWDSAAHVAELLSLKRTARRGDGTSVRRRVEQRGLRAREAEGSLSAPQPSAVPPRPVVGVATSPSGGQGGAHGSRG